ncbi:hypothetical protein C8Q73DRAFT_790796 [Cubamyces lactineus]|nr:hypothetical protein C8Q73DRAFT_790796 [Cubamyces lactineus]
MIIALFTCMTLGYLLALAFIATHLRLSINILEIALEHRDPLDPVNDKLDQADRTLNNSSWDDDQENQQPLPIPPPLARRLSSPPPEYTSRSPSPASSTSDLSTVGVEDSHLVDHSRHPDVNQLLRALLTNPTPVVNATERGLQYFLREYRCLYNEQRELDALEGNLVDAADIAEDALDALHEAFGEEEEQRQVSDYDIAERQARALENVGHHAHELRRLARHSLNTTRRLARTTRTWRNFLIQTFELPAFRARMAPLASVINDAAPPPGELPAAARRVPGEARRQGTYLPLFHTRVSAGSRRPRDPSPDERNVQAVYPTLPLVNLPGMSIDQVIAHASEVSPLLDHTVDVIKSDRSDFQTELARYIESQDGSTDHSDDQATSAYWPLICHIQIWTKSALLRCGATLVDLPGLGDIAPITRAVDDKVARDLCGDVFKSQLQMNGKYHPDAITFIATKCDDISCKEVIKGLKLAREPRYQQIESRLEAAKRDRTVHLDRKRDLAKLKSDLEGRLKFLTCAPTPQVPPTSQSGQLGGQALVEDDSGTSKRARETPSDADDHRATKQRKVSDSADMVARAESVVVQQEPYECANEVYSRLLEVQREFDRIAIALKAASDQGEHAERDKILYCTLRRSEWSKAKLRAQFRAALDEIEDAKSDPDTMVETTHIRTDLPVFTIAARAFMDIQGDILLTYNTDSEQVTSPFTESDTGILALREWIEVVTLAAREEAAAKVLIHLRDFARTVRGWVDGIPGVTLEDRERLQARWRSQPSDTPEEYAESDEDEDCDEEEEQPDIRQVQLERYSQTPNAVVPRLLTASSDPVKASQEFVYKGRMTYQTYAATFRRNGVFKRDLNAALAVPLTKRIAYAWANVFKTKSLKGLKSKTATEIKTVLDAVVATMPKYLRPRAEELAAETLQTAQHRLQDIQESVQAALNKKQREVSGALSPLIQEQLMDGYEKANNAERGKGVFARQKSIFNEYLESKSATHFVDTADTVEEYLGEAADAAGEALYKALERIAKEVEVEISILWEGCPVKDNIDVQAGLAMGELISEITEEVGRWLAAKDASDKAARRPLP